MMRMARALVVVSALYVALALAGSAIARVGSRSPLTGCRLSQFTVSIGPYISEATEQATLALRLVYRGNRRCTLNGYPYVRVLDERGAIPFVIQHGHDQMITPRPPRPVLVRPGGSAFVILNRNLCQIAVSSSVARGATRIEIGTADSGQGGLAVLSIPRRVPMPYRVPVYCGKGQLGSTIAVSPFEPTLQAGLNG